jgi:hypothetical protein
MQTRACGKEGGKDGVKMHVSRDKRMRGWFVGHKDDVGMGDRNTDK